MDSQYSSPVIYLRCSKRFLSTGTFRWGNPRDVGTPFVDENNETIFAGPTSGRNFFTDVEEMRSRQFIKGGSVVFVFSFHGEQIFTAKLDCNFFFTNLFTPKWKI